MKATGILKGLLLGLAVLLATSAFAANKGSLQFSDPVIVNGTALPAGDYTVKWEGTGPNVEATILQGKNVVATVPAKVIDLDRAPNMSAAVVKKSEDGSATLNQIRFSGKKIALDVSDQAVARTSEGTSK